MKPYVYVTNANTGRSVCIHIQNSKVLSMDPSLRSYLAPRVLENVYIAAHDLKKSRVGKNQVTICDITLGEFNSLRCAMCGLPEMHIGNVVICTDADSTTKVVYLRIV